MPRTYFTERDILELHAQGARSLDLGPDDRMTDLARERAAVLGMTLDQLDSPAPTDLHTKVRQAVLGRLGDSVDPVLVDRVIRRVLQTLGRN
jgi:hypothetical protein